MKKSSWKYKCYLIAHWILSTLTIFDGKPIKSYRESIEGADLFFPKSTCEFYGLILFSIFILIFFVPQVVVFWVVFQVIPSVCRKIKKKLCQEIV